MFAHRIQLDCFHVRASLCVWIGPHDLMQQSSLRSVLLSRLLDGMSTSKDTNPEIGVCSVCVCVMAVSTAHNLPPRVSA